MDRFRASLLRLTVGTLAGLLATAGSAAASTFNVAPIRVEMDADHQTGVLTLHNDGEAPVTVQVQAAAWSQEGGEDVYRATRDLLVTPPVFVVPPNGDQIVRVARRARSDSVSEQAYRLFFQEVPEAAAPGFNGLKVALRISLPVFIAATATAPNELVWRASWPADGTLRLEAANRGLAHVQITDFAVAASDKTVIARIGGARYLLPGSHAVWAVTPIAGVGHGSAVRIRGYSDRGEIVADVPVAAP